jgi:hypothetical protein
MKTKVTNFSNPTTRRRLASEEGVRLDLESELDLMFKAFSEAKELFEQQVIMTPPEARSRGFEAQLLNSKMIQSIQKNFPNNWKFGKYKRFVLRTNGYQVLFKKLNKKGMPMNIKTKTVAAISQQTSLSLFDNTSSVQEPILFFGYQKDKIGEVKEPKLIYIDEDQCKWTITADQIAATKEVSIAPTQTEAALPTLKKKSGKKAVGQ